MGIEASFWKKHKSVWLLQEQDAPRKFVVEIRRRGEMLTPLEFAERVLLLKDEIPFSVSSWGRTETHNEAVGGVNLSAHRKWLAADIIPDNVPTLASTSGDTVFANLSNRAARYDLEVIDEWVTKGHYHLQVKGWANIAW